MMRQRQHVPESGWRDTLISVALVTLTALVFGQTLRHGFLSYDDRAYVSENPVVASGLTWSGLGWGFVHAHAGNWHPLTTISHMLDCRLFGLNAGGHHLTNVLLHSTAAVLLFFALSRMTATVWRSFFVAAVFAIHPLHVESVAWVAERKDVLSGVFFLLTLLAYRKYAERPSTRGYVATGIAFSAGLMAKPMLVTTPLILLLLDYWPLRRMADGRSARKTIFEKIPLLLLSVASSIVTLVVQQSTTASLQNLPLSWRVKNALITAVIYLRQTFWPVELAAFYPHPQGGVLVAAAAGAAILLAGITVIAWLTRKTRPYVIVGWLWYLIMLAPVIGIVQVGLQSHADRYTYLPQIGIVIALAWTIYDLLPRAAWSRVGVTTLATAAISAFAVAAWFQTRYWESDESLWTHALAVTSNNDVAHNNLGNVYLVRGQFDEAISHFQQALDIRSRETESQYNFGAALSYNNLGTAFVGKGNVAEGTEYFGKALAVAPGYADAHYNLGKALFRQGNVDGAIEQWRTTVSLAPNDGEAHTSLADALLRKGELREAVEHYERAIKASSPSVFALNNLAWVLSTAPDASFRNGPRAIELARAAVSFTREKVPAFVRTLAAACAEKGRFPQATEIAQHAHDLALRQNDRDLAAEIENDLDLYRKNMPIRDSTLTDPDAHQ
jgi:tetratricopeptide (TPR) repeat protein